ncbi:HTH DNA binding domain protein [Gordonia phage Cozz]|uniref:HTH DNA binding domain protein n=1 Tax=Gordonia phage Cozz TaxID=1838066 RepID=A0A166Y575_9CAUD|nr:HTH DNA binding domain protein [Gordonia phage Cozz]ANA85763.1 HTH DNA binding domain protein [Gordonia phage Cozz]
MHTTITAHLFTCDKCKDERLHVVESLPVGWVSLAEDTGQVHHFCLSCNPLRPPKPGRRTGVPQDILFMLEQHPEGLRVMDFVDKLGIIQGTVSQSLNRLKKDGLVMSRKTGEAKDMGRQRYFLVES